MCCVLFSFFPFAFPACTKVNQHTSTELDDLFRNAPFVRAVEDVLELICDKYQGLGEGTYVDSWLTAWGGDNLSRVEVNTHGSIVRGGIPPSQQGIEARHQKLHVMNTHKLVQAGKHIGRLCENLETISRKDYG